MQILRPVSFTTGLLEHIVCISGANYIIQLTGIGGLCIVPYERPVTETPRSAGRTEPVRPANDERMMGPRCDHHLHLRFSEILVRPDGYTALPALPGIFNWDIQESTSGFVWHFYIQSVCRNCRCTLLLISQKTDQLYIVWLSAGGSFTCCCKQNTIFFDLVYLPGHFHVIRIMDLPLHYIRLNGL